MKYEEILAKKISPSFADMIIHVILNSENVIFTPAFRFNLILADPDDNKLNFSNTVFYPNGIKNLCQFLRPPDIHSVPLTSTVPLTSSSSVPLTSNLLL